MANRFLNNIRINDSYTLPTADGTENQIVITDGAGNLSFNDLGTITGAVNGVESNLIYYEVKNSSGSQILKGKGVMAVGTDGNSGHILIDEMVADGSVEARYFLGVLSETLNNGDIGRVIAFGELDQFNTNGQNGETWTNGQVLWCDPDSAGDFTITEPDGPNVKIPAAFILKASTNGKIQVRVQANEGIHQLHDTKIVNQVDGDVLVWDNTTGVWFNDSTLNVDYTNSRVGIGTTDPSEKLDVAGNIELSGNVINASNTAYYLDLDGTSILNHGKFTSTLSFGNFSAGSRGTLLEGYSTHSVVRTDSERLDFYMGKTTTGVGTMMSLTDTGRVGIGTTNPIGKLHLSTGTTNGSGDTLYIERPSASNYSGISFATSGSVDWSIGHNSAGGFSIYENGQAASTRFIIKDGGNVGIGTTSPMSKVHVFSPGYPQISLGSNAGNWQLGVSTGNEFAIRKGTSGSNFPLWIDSNSNIGIGTTSPGAKLQINNDSTVGSTSAILSGLNPILYLDAGRAAGRSIVLKTHTNGNDTVIGALRFAVSPNSVNYSHASIEAKQDTNGAADTLEFRTSNSNTQGAANNLAMIIRGGNVGIGTTSPAKKLEVDGTVHLGSSGNNVSIGASNSSVIFMLRSGYNYIQASDASGALMFRTGGANNRMIIDSSGNVGIGTTNPGSRLTVSGTNNATSEITLINTNPSTDNDWSITPFYNDQTLRFRTNSATTTVMTLKDNGNVGIGTTTPDYKLEVSGNAALSLGADRYLRIGSSTNYWWDLQSVSNDFTLKEAGSNTRVIVKAGGNVGIGTTTPAYKLDVNGGAGVALRLNSTSDYQLMLSSSNSWTGIGFNDGAASGTDFIWYNGVNQTFAIGGGGSNVSGKKLHVHGAATIGSGLAGTAVPTDGLLVEGNVGIGTTSPNAKLHVYNTGNGEIEVERASGALVNIQAQSAKGLIGTDSNHTFSLKTNSSERLTILTSGNVGIGTTSPSAKLEVSGNIAVSVDNRVIFDVDSDGFNYIKSDNANSEELTFYSVGPHHFKNGEDNSYENVVASNFVLSSDERLKENTYEIQNENINVNWKTFNFKNKPEEKRYGVVAQELEKDHPEFVNTDNQGFKSVKYIDLLIAKIAELENRIKELEK